MVDVDHFKAYNDTYGHPAGDDVLKRISGVLRSVTARAGELAIRMGGEQFPAVIARGKSGGCLGCG